MGTYPLISAAIEVGTSYIRGAIALKQSSREVDLVAYDQITTPIDCFNAGDVINPTKISQEVAKIYSNLISQFKVAYPQSKITIDSVQVGVVGAPVEFKKSNWNHVFSGNGVQKSVEVRDVLEMNKKFISSFIGGEKSNSKYETFHHIPQDFIVDDRDSVVDPVGCMANRLETKYLCVSISSIKQQNIHKSISETAEPKILYAPLASALSVLSRKEKQEGVLLVDFNETETNYAFFKDGVVRHLGRVEAGGFSLANDIRYGCNLSNKEFQNITVPSALESKLDEANIKDHIKIMDKKIDTRNISFVSEVRLKEIASIIYAKLQFEGYLFDIESIVLTGGLAQIPYIDELFFDIFQRNTSLGTSTHYIKVPKSIDNVYHLHQPVYSTIMGLVLSTFEPLDRRQFNIGEYVGEYTTTTLQKTNLDEKKKNKPFATTLFDIFGKIFPDSDISN